jgi:hypothetical protein
MITEVVQAYTAVCNRQIPDKYTAMPVALLGCITHLLLISLNQHATSLGALAEPINSGESVFKRHWPYFLILVSSAIIKCYRLEVRDTCSC